MKTPALNSATLHSDLNLLENSLLYWRWQAPDMEPVCWFSELEVTEFITQLYRLSLDCLNMHHQRNATPSSPYEKLCSEAYASRAELIKLTREFLWCCNEELILTYRNITKTEILVIQLLQKIHVQLIGAEFYCTPGEETVTSDDYTF